MRDPAVTAVVIAVSMEADTAVAYMAVMAAFMAVPITVAPSTAFISAGAAFTADAPLEDTAIAASPGTGADMASEGDMAAMATAIAVGPSDWPPAFAGASATELLADL